MIELKDGSLITGGFELREDKIAARMFEMLNDRLSEAVGEYGSELHNYLFNEDDAFTHEDVAEEACGIGEEDFATLYEQARWMV